MTPQERRIDNPDWRHGIDPREGRQPSGDPYEFQQFKDLAHIVGKFAEEHHWTWNQMARFTEYMVKTVEAKAALMKQTQEK